MTCVAALAGCIVVALVLACWRVSAHCAWWSGPPYSIDPAEVERVFGGSFEINEIERWEVNEEEGWQKRMGTEWFNEVLYVLHRKLD